MPRYFQKMKVRAPDLGQERAQPSKKEPPVEGKSGVLVPKVLSHWSQCKRSEKACFKVL